MSNVLTKKDRAEISEILVRRSNEIASFLSDYRSDSKHFGSVELALSREIERLRRLSSNVNPEEPEEEESQ